MVVHGFVISVAVTKKVMNKPRLKRIISVSDFCVPMSFRPQKRRELSPRLFRSTKYLRLKPPPPTLLTTVSNCVKSLTKYSYSHSKVVFLRTKGSKLFLSWGMMCILVETRACFQIRSSRLSQNVQLQAKKSKF